MNKYTIICEWRSGYYSELHDSGTCISQIQAESISSVVEKWILLNDLELSQEIMDELIKDNTDEPVAIEEVDKVWCACLTTVNDMYLLNIVQSNEVIMAKKSKTVYVYHDMDHCEIEVFDTFDKALACFMERWGHEPEWELDDKENPTDWHDLACDYVTISKKEIQ